MAPKLRDEAFRAPPVSTSICEGGGQGIFIRDRAASHVQYYKQVPWYLKFGCFPSLVLLKVRVLFNDIDRLGS